MVKPSTVVRAGLCAVVLAAIVVPAPAQPALDELPIPADPPARPGDKPEPADPPEDGAAGAPTADNQEEPPPLRVTADPMCRQKLDALGVDYESVGEVEGENECGVENAYRIDTIDGVTVRPDTQLKCETVLALAHWLRSGVMPAARSLSRGAVADGGKQVRLSGLRHGSTYVCRRRNNRLDGRLSYHAIGAAIDIMAFEFEGRPDIAIEPRAGNGTIEEAFQRSVRASACLSFTTVLGPGSDEYHDDHLHLDIARRGGGYRLCQ